MKTKKFFVYALLDVERNGDYNYSKILRFQNEPYYIGITEDSGDNNRIMPIEEVREIIQLDNYEEKYHSTNKILFNKIRKGIQNSGSPIISIICDNLNYEVAVELVTLFTNQIGLLTESKGPLANESHDFTPFFMYQKDQDKMIVYTTIKDLEDARARYKMRTAKLGKKRKQRDPKWNEKIGNGNKGKKRSEAHKQAISHGNKGRKRSPEHIKKMQEGRQRSREEKRKHEEMETTES